VGQEMLERSKQVTAEFAHSLVRPRERWFLNELPEELVRQSLKSFTMSARLAGKEGNCDAGDSVKSHPAISAGAAMKYRFPFNAAA
jgi:hypothetical protein